MTLGQTIRRARVKKKVGLREFARQLKISPSYVSDVELDRRVPAEDVLSAIADALEVDRDALLALAGRLSEKATGYLKRNPAAIELLEAMADARVGRKETEKLVKVIEKKR